MLQQLLLLKGKLIRRNNGTKLALAPKSSKPDEPNTLRIRFSQNTTDPTTITELGTWERVENSEYNDWDLTFNNERKLTYDVENNKIMSVKFGNEPIKTIISINSLDNLGDNFIILDGKIDNSIKFTNSTKLTSILKLNTNSVTDISYMFYECYKVESGALALYQQANATGKVEEYSYAFSNCGRDTTTGLAELQQIPQSWGGKAAG